MSRKELILIIVGIVVVVLAAFFIRQRGGSFPERGTGPGGTSAGLPGGMMDSPTHAPVPEGAVAPGVGASDLPEGVGAPRLVTEAAPSVPYSYRSFSISVENGKFVPDTIIVNEKDTVNLKITASDDEYDFFQPDYGLSAPLPEGVTKTVEFGALLTGKLTFYCQSCGGPDSGPVGYIVVVPIKQ